VSPEQGQQPESLDGGDAHAGRHGAAVGARGWHLGCLILAAGRGGCPAQAVTAGGVALVAGAPAVAARLRLGRLHRLIPLNGPAAGPR
jgi:hypothetical protein